MNGLNRIFDELEAQAIERARHAAEDLGHIGGWFTPRASQDTAAATATVETNTDTGEHMSLNALEDQARSDLNDGIAYAHDLLGRLRASAPGIVATIDAVAGNPTLAKLAEAAAGRFLPPGVEEVALSMLSGLFASHGQPLQAAQPVQQAA